MNKFSIIFISALLLTACGGGGNGNGNGNTPTADSSNWNQLEWNKDNWK